MNHESGILLKGGTVVDGTGAPPYAGDVAVQDERIISILTPNRSNEGFTADNGFELLDCSGSIIAPGFIDAHSHSDLQVMQHRTEKLLQGVTAEVVGNCGFSAFPAPEDPQVLRDFANGILCGDDNWGWDSAADYLDSANRSPVATVASLVGHGSLRIKVVGNTSRELSSRELDTLCGLLDEALEEGATGFSSGLMYAPGSGATAKELVALCEVVARKGRIYTTHMRSYSIGLLEAVEEQLYLAEASECKLQISHLQAAGEENWPKQQRAIELIEEASERGMDVAFDAYPWLAGSTVLTQILPQSALDGGVSQLLFRLRDPVQRETIRTAIKPEASWNHVVITSAVKDEASLVGRSIQQIADTRGSDPANVVIDILLEQEGVVNIVEHSQSLENLHALLTHPLAMVITDGAYSHGRPHPRLYGTFPLLLGDIVRERKWLTLEEAVHKVTGKPAERFDLRGRGRIAEGYIADITVFDPQRIHTDATYEVPAVAPQGIRAVIRNGSVVVNAGTVV